MKKILIVDDAPGIRVLLTNIISRKEGFHVTEASSVKDAASLCAANRYDLIFLDHRLRDGVGWEIAEMIFLDPQKYGTSMIIAMSGSVIPGKDDKCSKYYSQFIPKPFEIAQVDEILENLSKESSARS
ncbi:MAG TPA: hypothetical protein DCZ94_05995 [Lentisphaeria bacterium]|nr:MAG: hypothetical protein A2X48_07505 [Lentisphaerae bacterium GWF2_49_21]HBC86488.1 hypothetical protein [Lentisphaeria bacterium]